MSCLGYLHCVDFARSEKDRISLGQLAVSGAGATARSGQKAARGIARTSPPGRPVALPVRPTSSADLRSERCSMIAPSWATGRQDAGTVRRPGACRVQS